MVLDMPKKCVCCGAHDSWGEFFAGEWWCIFCFTEAKEVELLPSEAQKENDHVDH